MTVPEGPNTQIPSSLVPKTIVVVVFKPKLTMKYLALAGSKRSEGVKRLLEERSQQLNAAPEGQVYSLTGGSFPSLNFHTSMRLCI